MQRPLAVATGTAAAVLTAVLVRLGGAAGLVVPALVLVAGLGAWVGWRVVQRRARGVRWALGAAVLAAPLPTLLDGMRWSPAQAAAYGLAAAAGAVTLHRRPVARPALRLVRSEG